MKVITITNIAGRKFVVKRIDAGEWYGREPLTGMPCLKADKPLIEFWDATCSDHGPIGQIVSRYFVDTLLTDQRWLAHDGLNLDGGVPEWQVSPQNMVQVLTELCGSTS